MKHALRTALSVLAVSSLAVPSAAQVNGPSRVANATVVTSGPVIDGRLDESAWAQAELLDGFVQQEPMEGTPISERTEVRVVYDEQALYVGAWLYDSQANAIVFGEQRRDAAIQGDAFLVILDTYLDRQNGFVFGTTPSGIEYDGQVANEGQGGGGRGGRQQASSGGGFNLNWDGVWQVASTRDANGWYAEMRIPFSTLRYASGGAQEWGINFQRNIRRNNEQAMWSPVPRQFNLYRVSMAGTLTGLQAPQGGVFTVTPYSLGQSLKDYSVTTPEWDTEADIGVDAKLSLSQSMTMDLTVNTDFAQAEVDDQQVNLTRFPLFFPEKRAFFLENAGTFSVGSGRSAELFFSRRIGLERGNAVPIQAGSRITGRLGGLQVGALNIQTASLDVPDATGVPQRITDANNFGVLRLYKEMENRTQLGAIFVSRLNTESTSDYNLTYGLDGAVGVGEALTLNGWGAVTTTPGVGSGEYGFNTSAQWQSRDWEWSAGYRQIGDSFNPEVGFVSRRAYRHANSRVLYHIRTPSVSWFREFRPHVSWSEWWDLSGFSETRMIHIDNHFAFENGAFFQLPGFNITGEGLAQDFVIRRDSSGNPLITIPAGSYNHMEWAFRYNTNRSAPLSISGGWTLGGFYTGSRFTPNAQLAYRFRDRLVTSLNVRYFDINLAEGDFSTSVVSFRGVYSFTPSVYLQATLQYNDDTENFGSNIQFGWLNTAGTGLYVVINDTEHWGSLATTGIPRGPQARQLVVKYTKLFDLRR